jgi:hypothetical protein
MASTDSTHSMSNTNYALMCFGVLGNNKDGSLTFFLLRVRERLLCYIHC